MHFTKPQIIQGKRYETRDAQIQHTMFVNIQCLWRPSFSCDVHTPENREISTEVVDEIAVWNGRELMKSKIFLGETVTSISTNTLDPIIQGDIELGEGKGFAT